MKNINVLRRLPNSVTFDEMNSPVGELTLITSEMGLHCVLWDLERQLDNVRKLMDKCKQSKNDKLILKTKKQLIEYFEKKRTQFDLPLVMNGTHFQNQAWKQLLQIPYGTTISYGKQAQNIGNKNLARAVGMANGLNPISIIVPCHRVIGSTGHLVGFGGGLERKSYLLNLESSGQSIRFSPQA